ERFHAATGHGLHVGHGERLAADRPFPALSLLDANPGDLAHGLAFHGDDGVGDFPDHGVLLLRCENTPDQLDIDEWHVYSLRWLPPLFFQTGTPAASSASEAPPLQILNWNGPCPGPNLPATGGCHEQYELWPVLPCGDGRRNSLHPLDDGRLARTDGRLDPLQ